MRVRRGVRWGARRDGAQGGANASAQRTTMVANAVANASTWRRIAPFFSFEKTSRSGRTCDCNTELLKTARPGAMQYQPLSRPYDDHFRPSRPPPPHQQVLFE